MESDLKPCPFCGGEGRVIRIPGNFPKNYVVVCWNEGCEASLGNYSATKEEAADEWNRRADNG